MSAIFALRQVNQLRRAVQLDGTMRIFAKFSDPEFIAARNFVLSELAEKLKAPVLIEELRSYRNVDTSKHPEYHVFLFLQLVGSLVKNRLVDGPGIYEFAQYSIVKSWEVLEPVGACNAKAPTIHICVAERSQKYSAYHLVRYHMHYELADPPQHFGEWMVRVAKGQECHTIVFDQEIAAEPR